MRGHTDLRAALAAAVVCAAAALILPWAPLRLLFAAPLALFLPGYAVTAACFARHGLEPLRFALLSVGLSLAVLALGALPLNYLPGGIAAGWWAAYLVLVVAAAGRGAALRRASDRRPPRARSIPAWNRSAAVPLGLAGLIAIAALILVFTPLPAHHVKGFTELWMVPSTRADVAVVGIASREQGEAEYLIELRVGSRDKPFDVHRVRLRPGQEWRRAIVAPAAFRGHRARVTATLFKTGRTAIYRYVAGFFGPIGGSP